MILRRASACSNLCFKRNTQPSEGVWMTGGTRREAKVKMHWAALARWLNWLECHAIYQKVPGSVPGQGT